MDEICLVGIEYNLHLNCQLSFFCKTVFVISYKMSLVTSYEMIAII